MILINTILKLSGIIDRIIKATIILNLPSKILGALFGLIQNFIVVFIILFVLSHFKFFSPYLKESKYGNKILNDTPVFSNYSKEISAKLNVMYSIIDKYKNSDTNKANLLSLQFMVENNLMSKDNLKYLIDKKKITINDEDNILK